jgi:pectinesterase
VQLTVLDALGRVVLTQKVAAGQAQTQLDLSGVATGVYLLRATTDGGTDVLRIVRE